MHSRSLLNLGLALAILAALPGCAPANRNTTYRIDADSAATVQRIGNIENLTVVSNNGNVLKAEYEAGFMQGKLQASELDDTRDNAWDTTYMLDPAVTGKKRPPTAAALETAAQVLRQNYAYTLDYINRQSPATLREQLSRLVFRMLGIYHGAVRSQPAALDFSGTWLPALDTFGDNETRLTYGVSKVTFMDVYFLNAYQDLGDVLDNMPLSKCSAFVKKTENDILLTHNTWSGFLDQSMAATYWVNGDFITFNAVSPGLFASTTDFGYNGKGIIFNETTHHATYTEPKTDALWMLWRAALAEQFAGSLDEFYNLVSLELSGTYMNGYMVVDSKTRAIGIIEMSYKTFVFFRPDSSGGYSVITKPEGAAKQYDTGLLQPDYILGINYPVSFAIRDDLKAMDTRPQRRIQFLAQIGGVTDVETAKALITYTAPGEPLSIYGRWDLGFGDSPAPKTVPDGALDAKVIAASQVGWVRTLAGVLDASVQQPIFWMKYGTATVNGKPFIWSESAWKGQPLRLVPDRVDGPWELLHAPIR
jgi:hypothetical protein